MKRMNYIFKFFFLALAAVSLSCSSDDDGGGGGGSAAAGTVKAKAGNKNFTSMQMASWAAKNATGAGTYQIVVQGSDAEGTAIQLILNGVDGQPGTWDISDENNIAAIGTYTEVDIDLSNPMASTTTTWGAPYENSGKVGSITITEINDTTVKGTFNFTARIQEGGDGTKSITNGAFNVDFQ